MVGASDASRADYWLCREDLPWPSSLLQKGYSTVLTSNEILSRLPERDRRVVSYLLQLMERPYRAGWHVHLFEDVKHRFYCDFHEFDRCYRIAQEVQDKLREGHDR